MSRLLSVAIVATALAMCSTAAPSWAAPQPQITEPVAVYDVDAAGRLPYRCSRFEVVPAEITAANILCDAVPAGFRLALEWVSVKVVGPTGMRIWASVGVGPEVPPVNSVFLVPTSHTTASTDEEWIVISQAMRFYVEPGQVPSVRSAALTFTSATSTARSYEITLQGTLIPIRPLP